MQIILPTLTCRKDDMTSTYTDLNIRKVERLTNTQADGLDPTYSQLNFRRNELLIAKVEDPPFASRPGEMPVTAQAAAQEQQSKVKIGNRPYRLICLLCLVTAALIVIVAGLSIHVSQIRQSYETCHRNSNLSVLKRMNSDLRHQFTEVETKYRSVSETKAQICEFLTSRREQTCSKDWVSNKDRCYYVSTSETPFPRAKQECSNRDSRLLEINSRDEARFVSHNLLDNNLVYWTEKCENGLLTLLDRNVGWSVLYKRSLGTPECIQCGRSNTCDGDWNFICEKSAPLFPDIPEKIQGLCQQPVEST
ncbi:uncharacterized protein [Hemitrygon akajei]|uniref:uncharacterized protein isoform X2 n=1 Tax=Hemitrygon akajei TaxID=2704970 RepID=UPI003BF99DC8